MPPSCCRAHPSFGRLGLSYSLVVLSEASSAAAPNPLDQLIVTPPQILLPLSRLVGDVTFVSSSPVTTKWNTGVIENAPAVSGSPADRSRWVNPLSWKLKKSA